MRKVLGKDNHLTMISEDGTPTPPSRIPGVTLTGVPIGSVQEQRTDNAKLGVILDTGNPLTVPIETHPFPELWKRFQNLPNPAPAEGVEHPGHYQSETGLECWDIWEALGILVPACQANVLKYLFRAGNKPGEPDIKDLRKAVVYINKAIDYLEKKEEKNG